MRRARSTGDTLWALRGNGSVVVGERLGSWSCAWSGLAVQGPKPVMHRLCSNVARMSEAICGSYDPGYRYAHSGYMSAQRDIQPSQRIDGNAVAGIDQHGRGLGFDDRR